MLKKILIVLVIAVAAFAVVAFLQPDEFRVTRTAAIAAPADVIFAQVDDLRKWDGWSPWAKLDPNATHSFDGPSAGAGASMRWAGNMEVGEGSMTTTESRPYSFIQFRLDFVKPMQATNTAEFTFVPEGDRTTVTWTMYGTNSFIGKAMGLIFNCEKMVGEQFEQGLANLTTVSESAARAAAEAAAAAAAAEETPSEQAPSTEAPAE